MPQGSPYAPQPCADRDKWNDLGWIYGLGAAPADLERRIAAGLLFTGGKVKVMRPENPFGRRGRWLFKTSAGDRRQAMTDQVDLKYRTDSSEVVIQDAQSRVLKLKPQGDSLTVFVQGELPPLKNMCFAIGDPLKHFASLYALVVDDPCTNGVTPTFEAVEGVQLPDEKECEGRTPGDLCPMALLV